MRTYRRANKLIKLQPEVYRKTLQQRLLFENLTGIYIVNNLQ